MQVLICLFGSIVWLAELPVKLSLELLLLTIVFNLVCQKTEVVHVVLLFHVKVVIFDDVLLFLLPVELLFFQFSLLFQLVAFCFEPCLCLIGDFAYVVSVSFAFVRKVVVDFEGPLRSHEARVCVLERMNLFALKGKTDHVFDVEVSLFSSHEMLSVPYFVLGCGCSL